MIVERKPRIGLLLIGSPRFKPLGGGTAHGTYAVSYTHLDVYKRQLMDD